MTWLQDNGLAITAISALGVLLLIATVFATPRLVAALPSDYFRKQRPAPASRSLWRLAITLVRNLAGITLVLFGLVLLITPGPGLVCLVLGLALCEFPGKHVILRRVVGSPNVFATLNWLRRRARQAPFLHPQLD